MMSRVWSLAALACAATVGLGAQTSSSPTQMPSSQSSQGSSKPQVMVTGCIQRSSETTTGTSGTSSSMNETKYILTNATESSSGSGWRSSTGTSGSSSSGSYGSSPSTSSSMRDTYQLDAADSKLSPHVGHKVEITGTLENSSWSGSSSNQPSSGDRTSSGSDYGSGSSSAQFGSSSSSMNAPKLKVDNVRMISSSCSE